MEGGEARARARRRSSSRRSPTAWTRANSKRTIGAIIEDRKLPQLLGQSNESNDKDGLRLVLELKPDTDPNLVMAYLYKHTELQKTFSYNMTALVPGPDEATMVPKDGLSLKDMLRHFLDFRLATVRRRFEYQLRQLRRRIHILEGFAIIFNALDQAIKIIRESSGKPDAAEKLKAAFKLDDEQVTAILDSQLYKIAQMEIKKILDELKEKKAAGRGDRGDPGVEKKLWGVIKGEMEALDRAVRRAPQDAHGVRRGRAGVRRGGVHRPREHQRRAHAQRLRSSASAGWRRSRRRASKRATRSSRLFPGARSTTSSSSPTTAPRTRCGSTRCPATTGYGEPITKFFRLGDGVKVIAAVTTDPRFTPADEKAKGDSPGRPVHAGRREHRERAATAAGRVPHRVDEGRPAVRRRSTTATGS